MSTTPLAPSLRIRNLADNSTPYQSYELLDWEIVWALSKVTTYRVELALGDSVTLAIIEANGGTNGKGPALPYLCELILGGNTVDCRFLATTPTMTITDTGSMVLAGNDIFDLYSRAGVDRVTFHAVSVYNMLNGAPGTIPLNTAGAGNLPNIILKGGTLSFQKGIFQTTPGRNSWAGQSYVLMAPHVDPVISGTPLAGNAALVLDMDLYGDTIADSLDTIMKAVGGYYFPADWAPIGTRQYWLADSSDDSLNLTGSRNGIACGFVGKDAEVFLTFTNNLPDPTVDETTTAEVLDPLEYDPSTDEMYSQAEFIGGSSDHGLPAGGNITAMTTVQYAHASSATDWSNSLLVVGIGTSGNGSGGFFYTVQDGAFRKFSQAFDVNDLSYNEVTGLIYGATASGAFLHSDDVLDPSPWQLVGGLTLPVKKIIAPLPPLTIGPVDGPLNTDTGLYLYQQIGGAIVPLDPTTSANLYDIQRVYLPGGAFQQVVVALVSGSGSGADGIYINTDADAAAALGHVGWTQIVASSSIIDMGASLDTIYYADTNNPSYLQSVSTAGVPYKAQQVPNVQGGFPAILGIDSQQGSGYTYIRTAAGALGLFVLGPGAVGFGNANPDGTLLDDNGYPVLVNQIQENRPKSSVNGIPVALFALTDNGLYSSLSPTGGGWAPCDGQSGIESTTVSLFTMGAQQTILGRVVSRLYVGGGTSLYLSNTGGIWWRDLFSDLLDLGPFWMALAQQCPLGAGLYPDNMLSNLGDLAGFTPDSTGNTVPIPNNNPRYLPPGWIWSRRLDEHNDFVYRLVNLGSSDPHNGIMFAEINELQTNVLMGAITASERLALSHFRWLAQASTPQTRMTLDSSFWTQEAGLRRLRPTHRITADITESFKGTDGTLRTVLALEGGYNVLQHTIKMTQGGGGADTETIVSSVQHAQPLTPEDVGKAFGTTLKNIKRYSTYHAK